MMEEIFGKGTVSEMDFASNPEAARKAINAFVSKNSNGKIPELLAPGKILPSTLFCLVNALYFKGEWAQKFDVAETKNGTFYSPSGTVQTPLMHQVTKVNYYEGQNFQAIALPYIGNNMSMVVVLPGQGSHFEPSHDFYNANFLWQSSKQTVDVTLPRFEVRTQIELTDMLTQTGLTGLRYPEMSSAAGEVKGINGVTQAVFKVDEFGGEGAAATAISGVKGLNARPEIKTFRADHPFYFAVMDHSTGTILFEGHITDPSH